MTRSNILNNNDSNRSLSASSSARTSVSTTVSDTIFDAATDEALPDVLNLGKLELLARSMKMTSTDVISSIRTYVADEMGYKDPISYHNWTLSIRAHNDGKGKNSEFSELITGIGTARRGGKFLTLDFPEDETEAWTQTMDWTWTEFIMYLELIDVVSIPVLLKTAFMSEEQFNIFKNYCSTLIDIGKVDFDLLRHLNRSGYNYDDALNLIRVAAMRWLKMMIRQPAGRKYIAIDTWEQLFETVAVSDTETDFN